MRIEIQDAEVHSQFICRENRHNRLTSVNSTTEKLEQCMI